ncbi:MAG TPA: hypothetical protein VGN60_12975 [Devosia sp.]|jgi:hypothetical protein|nr:hypothetical protein [Devosia sp.]
MAKMDKVLQLVGQLNYVWTNTESLFIYLIAHLTGTNKEAAVVIFLTLNTTRARIDLLERLAKLKSTPPQTRRAVLDVTERLKQQSKVRNKYNHCIYSFDANGELSGTQLMRIAEWGDDIKYGKLEDLDEKEMDRIEAAIAGITAVNREIWSFMAEGRITV